MTKPPKSSQTADAGGGGCPVDHENMSKEEIAAFMSQRHRQAIPEQQQQQQQQKEKQRKKEQEQRDKPVSACPVDHENMSKEQIAAFMSKSPPSSSETSSTNDNTSTKSGSTNTVYDVYGQELDKSNMMPSTPNQLPSPGQKEPLSTDRVQSTIPKTVNEHGESETWTYPSPQMFYNSLHRKGKADGIEETDMPTVVAVHNQMNEQTWDKLIEWESKFHCDECKNPSLKRFRGRPHDLSPAAMFRTWLRGYPKPFDRHDWTVDRCGNAEVRYIIDYYFWDGQSNPIEIHVRPAIDSFSTAYDRFRNGLDSFKQLIGLPTPKIPNIRDQESIKRSKTIQSISSDGMLVNSNEQSTTQPGPGATSGSSSKPNSKPPTETQLPPEIMHGKQIDAEEFSFLTSLTESTVQDISQDVQSRCTKIHEKLRSAASGSDSDIAQQANVSLNYCMAQRICKKQAQGFMELLESGKDPSEAYTDMTDCLDRFQIMARRAILEAAGVKQSGPEFPVGMVSAATDPSTDSTTS